ncbi:MAG TPA: SEC-C metal-binding domain-containing protein [Thermoanaerobaculia bacterium]|nr:SEC-C metal-binding domain-containing protein [Thermoanaerobaculia bacterium]HUM29765.1 SEC-C metal-binding domain-containing protein [Thermoanaerobaculia bacterium]HXK67065.1 SEC-C metal-binding domain-containing protein [Thermoanaerobaculia bacterium]
MKFFKSIFTSETPPAVLPGRNEPCWCGSGKKYKQCHYEQDQRREAIERARRCRGFT